MNEIDENTCLHCGKGKPGYCEDCYQDLIADNTRLQLEIEVLQENLDRYTGNIMTETEHTNLYARLYTKYVGQYTPDNTRITEVYVDYRKDHQSMNRVSDEFGNMYFINELEKTEE